MTELDFEELDKAVSDLMKDVGGAVKNPSSAANQSAPAQAVPAANTNPTQGMPENLQNAPLAVKRRGRFMDVVAPAPLGRPAPSAPKREGVTVTPLSKDASTAQSNIDSAPAAVMSEPINPIGPAGYAADPVPTSEWPDPIDVMAEAEAKKQVEPQSEPEAPVEQHDPAADAPAQPQSELQEAHIDDTPESAGDTVEVKTATALDATEDSLAVVLHPDTPADDWQADDAALEQVMSQSKEPAMESPFLPDAKVEKRPLGGFAVETAADQPTAPIAPTSGNTILPREFSSEVMSLELNDDISHAPEPSTPAATAQVASTLGQDSTKSAVPAANAPNTTVMYDTDAYHKPLEVTAKKKHGWLVIVWILVLLILGALSGAAYFFFTT